MKKTIWIAAWIASCCIVGSTFAEQGSVPRIMTLKEIQGSRATGSSPTNVLNRHQLYGRLDRYDTLDPEVIVINDKQYKLAGDVRVYSEKGVPVGRSGLADGMGLRYMLDEGGEVQTIIISAEE